MGGIEGIGIIEGGGGIIDSCSCLHSLLFAGMGSKRTNTIHQDASR